MANTTDTAAAARQLAARNPHWFRTLDRAEITDALVVWDYDLRVAVVSFDATFRSEIMNQHWDGWFDMRTPGGDRASSMNGERMWLRHPSTGQLASDAAAVAK